MFTKTVVIRYRHLANLYENMVNKVNMCYLDFMIDNLINSHSSVNDICVTKYAVARKKEKKREIISISIQPSCFFCTSFE